MEQAVPNLTAPRVYHSLRVLGPAGQDYTRLLQADYRVPNFEKIGACTCLTTAIESARIIQTSQNVVQSPSYEHCTRRIRVY